MNTALVNITALAVLSLGGIRASADVTDFLVNDDGGRQEQSHPRIALTPGGGFVIAWIDKRNGSNDIYMQRFTGDGTAVGPNSRINDDTTNAWQDRVAIATDLTEQVFAVWKDYRNGGYPFDPDIYLQTFDSLLAPIDTNRNVTTEWPDSLRDEPAIALSSNGGGVIVWSDYRNRNWDIYGQRVDADGQLIGSNFRINDDIGTSQQHAPRVSYAADRWFVVVWYDNRLGDDDIFAQRFDITGNPLGSNIRVNSDNTSTRQAFPDVATDNAINFTVVWVDWRNGSYPSNPDIYARRFDSLMRPVTTDTKLNSDNSGRAQREPAISADCSGNVAILWSDSADGSFDIAGQMIDVDGLVRETNFTANSQLDSAQLQADIAIDGRYRYVTWADKRNGNFDIYASIQEYNRPGMTAAPSHVAFVMEAGGALPPAIPLVISHTGYNVVSYQIETDASWLAVSSTSGATPDTVSVAVSDSSLPFGSYFAKISIIDSENGDTSAVVTARLDVDTRTDAGDGQDLVLPEELELQQNYPNPFNPATSIGFRLPYASHVMLEIFDILGRQVNTLVNESLPAGEYVRAWGGLNSHGASQPSGIYFYRLTAGKTQLVRKMVLLK